jgi:hypothetical protein
MSLQGFHGTILQTPRQRYAWEPMHFLLFLFCFFDRTQRGKNDASAGPAYVVAARYASVTRSATFTMAIAAADPDSPTTIG